jgi:two-component system repressor protein LuxO
VVLNSGGLVTPGMLPLELVHQVEDRTGLGTQVAPRQVEELTLDGLLGKTLAEIERMVVEATIARFGGSVPRAARVLDVSPSTLYRKREGWAERSS